MYDAINAARSAGHLFVAAAGNSGQNADTSPMYPAAYNLDNIISVAAISSSNSLASFSNYGSSSVDIGAPGVSIFSTYASGWGYMSGTSMATPHVAGAAALLKAADPTATYRELRSAILEGARPTTSLSGKTTSGGRLDVGTSLELLIGSTPTPPPLPLTPPPAPLTPPPAPIEPPPPPKEKPGNGKPDKSPGGGGGNGKGPGWKGEDDDGPDDPPGNAPGTSHLTYVMLPSFS